MEIKPASKMSRDTVFNLSSILNFLQMISKEETYHTDPTLNSDGA